MFSAMVMEELLRLCWGMLVSYINTKK